MIKLKTIADLIDYRTDDLTTEFDDSKDIFFKTIEDEYIAILKIDDENSMLFLFSEHGIKWGEMDYSIELKNYKFHGRYIEWTDVMGYYEYKNGVLHGYSENAFQEILSERGFYKNGLKDGWWEYGDGSMEVAYYEDRDDFHSLENYRPSYFDFYSNGFLVNTFLSLDSEFEYQLACEREFTTDLDDRDEGYKKSYFEGYARTWKEWTKSDLDLGEIKKGRIFDYFSYETYLKMTNLPKLKTPTGKIEEMYDHRARSIDYDQILKEYNALQTKHKVSKDSFEIDNIKIYSG